MRPFARTTSLLLLAAVGLLLLNSCSKNDAPSLYDPNASYKPAPTITSIAPTGSAFAGMDTIVIQGTNFSSVLAENSVFFNASSAALLSATPTQISIVAPLVTIDSIGVRVIVGGSLLFSNTVQYKLIAGVAPFGGLLPNDTTTSLATDVNGNLYFAYLSHAIEAGISEVTPAGVRSTYAPATAGVTQWTGLKMGPGGYLYAARSFRALYRFSPGGGSSGALWLAFPLGTAISDIDVDQAGNVWGVGNNSNIYNIQSSKVITTSPFVGNIHSVRVYNGYLYFAAKTDAGEKIWRASIQSTSLGTPEIYWDFAAAYPTNLPLSITFSSDGTLYIGTDSPDGLVVVSPSKTVTAPFRAYRASFGTGLNYLAWGSSNSLYASTSNGILLKFIVRGKTSAPYYGSTM
jgi:hypothetical protein